ncbi:thioredoxin domain-containing protein [Isoptericola variabilis]|uniref:DSBA oxidoreductase n=1 Tax=Isoptericola variabilis (strain 225) TaxID=743718 RepID=F6FTU8_ISOV2|nr:thioredoxin domain-containing protein [Isoptericola variabilis]AEG45319.1 DSBA oxidoreductase [Isoptericola variabilis 225]TWH34822.1 protein-disulfide isomerase [Isoptericola variabilis J7]
MSTKNANMTKAQRREAARAEALALQQKQASRDRRNRIITFSVLGLAVVGLAVVIWMILQEGQKSAMEKVDAVPSTATHDGATGIPLGADGVAGAVNEGATEIGSYVDFLCPHCAEFEAANGEDLRTMLDDGDATLVMHPVAIVDPSSNGYSVRAAAAFVWVAENAPEQAFDYQQVLFENQPSGGSLTDQQLADLAEGVGVPADVAAGIGDGTAHDTYGEWVEAATDEVLADESLKNPESGGFGTPTVTIDGERWGGNWSTPGELLAAVTG